MSWHPLTGKIVGMMHRFGCFLDLKNADLGDLYYKNTPNFDFSKRKLCVKNSRHWNSNGQSATWSTMCRAGPYWLPIELPSSHWLFCWDGRSRSQLGRGGAFASTTWPVGSTQKVLGCWATKMWRMKSSPTNEELTVHPPKITRVDNKWIDG